MQPAPSRPTCFVGFYGLDRSLRWTARSIERNILSPLREYGFRLRVAGHFNAPREIENEASGERGIKPAREPTGLRFDVRWLELQDEALSHIDGTLLDNARSSADWQTRRNLALQLHSLGRLWELCRLLRADSSDLFVLLRPDLEYIDRIDVAQVYDSIRDGTDLVTPDWQQWNGLNDRFAFCSARGADAYCHRLAHAPQHIAERGGDFHAETFLKWVADREHLQLGYCKLRAMRVRADGKTWREGFKLTPPTNIRAVTRVYRQRLRRLI